jgi:hypothetical protein
MVRHPFPGLCLPARVARGAIRARRREITSACRNAMLAQFAQRIGFDLANALAPDGEQRPTKSHSEAIKHSCNQMQVRGLQF